MTDQKAPEWFYQLDDDAQAALLADPHGDVPGWIATTIITHVNKIAWDGQNREPGWQLFPDDARLIEAERHRRESVAGE